MVQIYIETNSYEEMWTTLALTALNLVSISPSCIELFDFNQTQCNGLKGFYWVNQTCKNTRNSTTPCDLIDRIDQDECFKRNNTHWEAPYCYGKVEIGCGCICPEDVCNVQYSCDTAQRKREQTRCHTNKNAPPSRGGRVGNIPMERRSPAGTV